MWRKALSSIIVGPLIGVSLQEQTLDLKVYIGCGMAKRKKKNLERFTNSSDLEDIQRELVGENGDRAAAIVGATILEAHLERLIAAFLIDDQKEVELLLSSDNPLAPLGGFSSKIRAAYCFGLISQDEFDDLKVIKDIRNTFAHHLFDCSFSNEYIQAKCYDLKFPQKLSKHKGTVLERYDSPRTRFVVTVYALESFLQDRASEVEHRTIAEEFAID